jgi:hypothetical protein
MKKQPIVFGIILLFIGVAISSSINQSIVKASKDNDLIEVTTQACGIKGCGDATVKLTREQYQDLKQYLIEFRARLNQTTTREEAIPIFKEAVVKVDKYGLLPKGMSIEQAQKLVTGEYLNKKTLDAVELLVKKKMVSVEANFNCLTAGHIFKPIFATPLNIIAFPLALFGIIYGLKLLLHPGPIETFIIECIMTLCFIPFIILYDISCISPVSVLLFADFPGCNLSTIGKLGMKNFSGNIEHQIYGFVGLKLIVDGFGINTRDMYLLGFSLYVGTPV